MVLYGILILCFFQGAVGTRTPLPINDTWSTLVSVKPLLTRMLDESDIDRATTAINKVWQKCESLRRELQAYSNDEIVEIIMNHLEIERETCVLIGTCGLETIEENKCPTIVDGIGTCFYSTPANEMASTSCPTSMSGIPYDKTKNVTRLCQANGTWIGKSNYSECKPVEVELCSDIYNEEDDDFAKSCELHLYNLKIISYVGKALGLATLIIAFMLFWVLRSIRCWRNIIHWNLVASFIMRNALWIAIRLFLSHQTRTDNSVFCRIIVTIYYYTQATNFFWMFVEGLYLHMMVVLAYSYDRIKLSVYMGIGWGLPMPLILLWAILKYQYEDTKCWMPDTNQTKKVEYAIQIPIITLLVVNTIILGNVVRILFTKLRAGYVSGGVSREAAQYTKAVKAAVFLFPLLGVTYIVFLVSPPSDSSGQFVFLYFNTFLQSFQGFFVCLIYCFANNEIQKAVMKKINSWKWQVNCPCCCWGRNDIGKNRRASSGFLSRTNNTMVTFRVRDTRDPQPSNNASQPARPISENTDITSPDRCIAPLAEFLKDEEDLDSNLNNSTTPVSASQNSNGGTITVEIDSSVQPLIKLQSNTDVGL